ncbi:hypothetical protein M8J75_000442 [Diaphorina citri]|nr:hypothetical protein M8J75_000442 [Diaphorina citri]
MKRRIKLKLGIKRGKLEEVKEGRGKEEEQKEKDEEKEEIDEEGMKEEDHEEQVEEKGEQVEQKEETDTKQWFRGKLHRVKYQAASTPSSMLIVNRLMRMSVDDASRYNK